MAEDLPVEKQLRLENIRRSLPEMSRQDLEEMLMLTTETLVRVTHKINTLCKKNGIL